ncbi:MAG: class IV adenylate cyclase, partial [Armatimonadota bacterium]
MPLTRNLETKARCRDLAEARRRAIQLGATEQWTRRQVDTYFAVPKGRLKLRRQEDAPAELIYYNRPDTLDARWSTYRIVTVTRAAELGNLLAEALGVLAHVDKTRSLLLYRNTRIHLDRVHGLGDFVELEPVIRGQSDEDAQAED